MSPPHGSRVAVHRRRHAGVAPTGLVRVLVLAWVLGFTPLADSFNLANTVPNMLFDLVLGGVASATFIPVFVERLARRRRAAGLALDLERGHRRRRSSWSSRRRWPGWRAPWIIDAFTALAHSTRDRRGPSSGLVATSLLRWFAPQIFFYGLIGIATRAAQRAPALRRGRLGAGRQQPRVHRGAGLVPPGRPDPDARRGRAARAPLMLLGLGTTVGVAVQFLLPRAVARARQRLAPVASASTWPTRRCARSRASGGWTLLVVVANQASLYVVLAFAFGIGGQRAGVAPTPTAGRSCRCPTPWSSSR